MTPLAHLLATSSTSINATSSISGLTRKAVIGLHLPAHPEPDPYTPEVALDYMPAYSVVGIVSPPGETNRLFLLNQYGLIMVVTNLAKPVSNLFLDISSKVERGGESGLLGLAFHPGYRTNGHFYVYYTTTAVTAQGSGLHDRLSRFSVSPDDPNVAQAESEVPLITQFDPDHNHNAGDLKFGPDGFLYLSLGDGGGGLDQFNNSQRIDKDFFSGILRIDVDNRPDSVRPNPHPASSGLYSIPSDNPFVRFKPRADVGAVALDPDDPASWVPSAVDEFNGLPVDPRRVRTEFYAVGLRNPWRFSFDALTGDLYCNDTGQDAREEVNLIQRGGNYGWAFMEGNIPGPRYSEMPAGLAPYLSPPILEYDHGQGRRAIVGGLFYRGDRYPELDGAYLFSDIQGDIGAIRVQNGVAAPVQWIAFSRGIATFGLHPATGEILFSDGIESYVRRLQPTVPAPDQTLPSLLSETGIFTDLNTLEVAEGLVPYDINLPFWSDHAIKTRWFGLSNPKTPIGFTRNDNWLLPEGMLWVKHFEMELTNGVPASARRLETRIIVRTDTGVYGASYRWMEGNTNAVLVPAYGEAEPLEIMDNGSLRRQVWHYPGRRECLACHTREGGYAIGFNAAQLNRAYTHGGIAANQLDAMSLADYFTARVPDLQTVRRLPRPSESDWGLEYRARAYLSANCSQCHQPGQASPGFWDARISASLPQTGIINGPLKEYLGDPSNRVIVPGRPEKSVILRRMSHSGALRMPPLGTSELDQEGIALISSWIEQLGREPATYEMWAPEKFPGLEDELAAGDADADGDGETNLLEFLTHQDPFAQNSKWTIRVDVKDGQPVIQFPRIAGRLFRVEWTDTLSAAARWRNLDVPANRHFISSKDEIAVVPDSESTGGPRYYRVRIIQP